MVPIKIIWPWHKKWVAVSIGPRQGMTDVSRSFLRTRKMRGHHPTTRHRGGGKGGEIELVFNLADAAFQVVHPRATQKGRHAPENQRQLPQLVRNTGSAFPSLYNLTKNSNPNPNRHSKQGSGCIIHLNIATCKWWFPFMWVLKKQHVSNGCNMDIF